MIVRTICEALDLDPKHKSTPQSRVLEGNAGVINFSKLNSPQMTPGYKHYSIKYNYFREQIRTS